MDLDYASTLSPELVDELERAARWIGLPLHKLELIGQSREHAEAFVRSVDRGQHEAYLEEVDWQELEAMLRDQPHLASLFGTTDDGFAVAQ